MGLERGVLVEYTYCGRQKFRRASRIRGMLMPEARNICFSINAMNENEDWLK
jgi:hypothetical protein